MQRRRFHAWAASAVAVPLLAPRAGLAASTQAWPNRPLRLLVGFPAGSTPDVVARALADGLAQPFGQAVVVENHPGAAGNLAAALVAKAADDHTLGIVINGNLTTAKVLNPALTFDPARDLVPLSLLTTAPLALTAPANLPSGAAFFEAAVKAGDRWNYGSVGTGSVAHLGMELLKSRVPGLAPVHVPFQGNPAVITALLGGQIQMALVPPGLVVPHVKTGRLRIIGLSSGRSTLAPEAASLREAGIRDFNLEVWTALVGPASLPPAARNRLAATVPALLHDAGVRQRLFNQGWAAVGSDAAAAQARVKIEADTLQGIIRSAHIQTE